jgi:hypothetical protein
MREVVCPAPHNAAQTAREFLGVARFTMRLEELDRCDLRAPDGLLHHTEAHLGRLSEVEGYLPAAPVVGHHAAASILAQDFFCGEGPFQHHEARDGSRDRLEPGQLLGVPPHECDRVGLLVAPFDGGIEVFVFEHGFQSREVELVLDLEPNPYAIPRRILLDIWFLVYFVPFLNSGTSYAAMNGRRCVF